MHSVTAIILHACITSASAKDFMSNRNGIEQNLMDRANSMFIDDANVDATTLAKPGTILRSPATMNRLPVTAGRPSTRVSAGLAEGTVAARYAQGLFEVAEQKKEAEAVMQGAASVALTLKDVPELAQMLSNPIVPEAKKRELIDKMLEKGTMNTMCNYLIDKSRIDVLPEIMGAYENLYNEKNGIESVEVKSACKLTEGQLSQIGDTVKARTGAKAVKINETVDDKLIGGFIVSYGGQQIDLSIRSGLDAVARELQLA
eukprot:gnl/MRDRNA2_/MRDRNA2_79576_c0_seq2.p1 gnl/MRDRNA2_/MRDRNA2_79576_c0~~gnl/MRDRNA2_/MRDRNA2_79576_c0_seq2.p1  ORF type:complete len:259 (+),score=47.44 gnl/MRDRNA2_/MRDRNA2_79576_c0_seq2:89-865(+)